MHIPSSATIPTRTRHSRATPPSAVSCKPTTQRNRHHQYRRAHTRSLTAGSQRAGRVTHAPSTQPRSPAASPSLPYRLCSWTRSAGFSSPSSSRAEAGEVTESAGVCAPVAAAPALRPSPLGETKGSAGPGEREVWATAALQVHHPQPPPAREGREEKAGPGGGGRGGAHRKGGHSSFQQTRLLLRPRPQP